MTPASRPLAVAMLGRGLVDADEPVIHADDAGLLRGLAAFETVRVYRGRPFGLDEHLERLVGSAARMQLPLPEATELRALIDLVLAAANEPDCALRLTVTGGRGGGASPVALVTALPLPEGLEETRQRGISVVALQLGIDPRLRRGSPWLLDGVKSTSYAVNMAAWDEARRRGADDAIFLVADGSVLEGTVTNLWWRHGSVLRTPSLDMGILAGVTRGWVLALARELGYEVAEGWFPLSSLATADEAFSSSSVRELMPIVALDGEAIGNGAPGDASRALQAALRRAAGA